MEEHLAKVKRMEQEKADLSTENFQRLEEQERNFAREIEKLKEKQRYGGKSAESKEIDFERERKICRGSSEKSDFMP